jgi:hypothetical protein
VKNETPARSPGTETRSTRPVKARLSAVALAPFCRPPADPVRGVERRRREALGQVELVGDRPRLAEDADSVRPPGRGEDPALGVGAAGTEVGRRLVHLVHESDRREEEAGPEVHLVAEHRVERQELDRDLAPLPRRGVLVLDLAVQDEGLVELPAEVDDGPEVVPLVRLPDRAPSSRVASKFW